MMSVESSNMSSYESASYGSANRSVKKSAGMFGKKSQAKKSSGGMFSGFGNPFGSSASSSY